MSTITYDKSFLKIVDPQLVSLFWKNPGASNLGFGATLGYFGIAAALMVALGFAGYLIG